MSASFRIANNGSRRYSQHEPTNCPELRPFEIEQHQIRAFLHSFDDHFATVRRDIEGAVEEKTTAVQFIPANAERRIDVADPGNCHF